MRLRLSFKSEASSALFTLALPTLADPLPKHPDQPLADLTAAGEALNGSAFEVGLNAAIKLNADKPFCLHRSSIHPSHLPNR